MNLLAILGASGHGTVVADAALAAGWKDVAFFDDAWPQLAEIGPWRVEGGTAQLEQAVARFDGCIVAIGNNATRLAKHRALAERGIPMVTIVHPSAVVSPFAELSAGSLVCAGAVINPFARLGLAAIVNTSASIDHHCELGDAVHVSPGAHLGGTVTVGPCAWIGIGASVKQGLRIGANVMVGAGAAVVRDVADGLTVMGVPARPAKAGE